MSTTKNIFFIDPGLLSEMDPKAGTSFILNLLRCEATRRRIPLQRIVLSSRTSSKDGGIDAKVSEVPTDGELLAKGSSYFQIKTGSSFKPWLRQHLLNELFGSKTARPSKARLGKEVRNCLNKNGRYVLITLGHDLLPGEHTDAVNHLKDLFKKCGYKTAKVDVIGQGQIVGLLRGYPSLCLDLKGLGEAPFQTYWAWAQNADMKSRLSLGEAQSRFINEIRSTWRRDDFQHIRIIGEPGIGKTRLVLEAASQDDLRPATIYVPHAEDFQNSTLFIELLKPDREYTAHLVIDECDERQRASIWNALKGKAYIKLITIDHGPENSSDASMKVLQCPPLSTDQVVTILTEYVGRRPDLSNWAEWCEGSPRVAHAVGDNLKRNPEDLLKSPATVPIWTRFVLGHRRLDSRSADEHFIVLRHLALFQKFGFEDPVSEEARFISSLVAEADPHITWAKFQSIVRYHQGRRILQGRHTLFIVPKALHVHLWVDFWNQHGRGFDFQQFMGRLPQGLRHWFLRFFIYAHASPVAQRMVKQLLTPSSGPFRDRSFLVSREGTRLLNYLAEADPHSTLSLLEQTFGKWPLEDLRAWSTGRQDIVWALGKIAAWKELFPRAAAVLTRLALAENAGNSNNSRGTLVELFGIGYGWAPTEAEPDERFPILEKLVRSSDTSERNLGLELCTEWLSPRGGVRFIGSEYQGLRPPVVFWRPTTSTDVFDAWRKVWRFLRNEIQTWPDDARPVGTRVLVDCGMQLLAYKAICKEILDTLFEVAEDAAIDKGHFIEAVVDELRYRRSRYPKGVLGRVRALDKKLTGSEFWDRFSRFVLFTPWSEDHVVRGGKIQATTLPARRVRDLAQEAANSPALLISHLLRILSSEGRRLPDFGRELALLISDSPLEAEILSALETCAANTKSDFVAGYVAGVCKVNPSRGDDLILRLLAKPDLQAVAVSAIFASPLSTRIVEKMLALYRDRTLPAHAFRALGFSAPINVKVPAALVEEVIATLVDRNEDEALSISLQLVYDYYCRDSDRPKLPEDLAYRVITRTRKSESRTSRGTDDFHWYRVTTKFRAQYPDRDLNLLWMLLEDFDHRSWIGHPHDASRVADAIVKANPREAWHVISAALDSEKRRANDVVRWLGRSGFDDEVERGAITWLDPEDVLSWMQAAPDTRIALLYDALPRSLEPSEGGEITERFIETFANDDRISSALIAHFVHAGSWAGLRSVHLSRKRDRARSWLTQTKSMRVQDWLTRYIATLNQFIEAELIQEERGL